MNAWQGFKQDIWCTEINVQNFIQNNYKPYLGNESFLAPISEKTALVWQEAMLALAEETAPAGVRDFDITTFQTSLLINQVTSKKKPSLSSAYKLMRL